MPIPPYSEKVTNGLHVTLTPNRNFQG